MLAMQKGDILTNLKQPHPYHGVLILHGCNCFHTMGAGIAKYLRQNFPAVYDADVKQTVRGDRRKLGTFSTAVINPWLRVLNCYTQYRYGRVGKFVEEWAVEACLKQIALTYGTQWHIRMPKIGCNLAGGDWEVIRPIIEREFQMYDVTIYYI